MNTTHDNPTSWHDLRDQLSPAQISKLERWEADPKLPAATADAPDWAVESQHDSMLFAAKEWAKLNTAPGQFADVPVPAGATADGWHSVDLDGTPVRSLEWFRHDAGKISVSVDGSQRATGEVDKGVAFYGASEGEQITAEQARAFAAALIEAADELDRLDGPHPVDSATRGCCGGIGGHTPDC